MGATTTLTSRATTNTNFQLFHRHLLTVKYSVFAVFSPTSNSRREKDCVFVSFEVKNHRPPFPINVFLISNCLPTNCLLNYPNE